VAPTRPACLRTSKIIAPSSCRPRITPQFTAHPSGSRTIDPTAQRYS
jgi:hypothetical protein